MRGSFATIAFLTAALIGTTVAVPVHAVTPSATGKYRNCKALNMKYPHGVGRTGAKDRTKNSKGPVRNFTINTNIYNANKGLDRDKDGIACEKH